MVSFLEANNLIHPLQSGFRRSHSTQTALLKITDDVRLGIDKGLVTVLVLFDFSKAFDSLNHAVLLSALRRSGFGVDALSFIHSYITDRTITVPGIDGSVSDFIPVTSGVPQGSSPGPILFIIFINAITSVLRHCTHSFALFADDLQIYLQCLPCHIDQIVQLINIEAEAIVRWATGVGLTINSRKTKAIILGSRHCLNALQCGYLPPVVVDGVAVPYEGVVRNLGVLITNDLSWNAHISLVSRRAYGVLHRLKFRGHMLPIELKSLLVTALIFPIIDYGCLVYNDASEFLNGKIARLLNSCLRFIYGLRRDAHISPFRLRSRWLSAKSRRLYFLGSLLYSLFSSNKPSYLLEFFPRILDSLRRTQRRTPSPIFPLPLCRTAVYNDSLRVSGSRFWDSLAPQIRDAPSLPAFKDGLMKLLLETDSH